MIGRPPPLPFHVPHPQPPPKVFAIGATGFLGPHVVRRLLALGHDVVVFHRGTPRADLPGACADGEGMDRAHRGSGRLARYRGRRPPRPAPRAPASAVRLPVPAGHRHAPPPGGARIRRACRPAGGNRANDRLGAIAASSVRPAGLRRGGPGSRPTPRRLIDSGDSQAISGDAPPPTHTPRPAPARSGSRVVEVDAEMVDGRAAKSPRPDVSGCNDSPLCLEAVDRHPVETRCPWRHGGYSQMERYTHGAASYR